jgi:excisionase family DNA binding protein
MNAPRLAEPISPAALTVSQAATYLGISRRTLYRISAERGVGKSRLPVCCIEGRRLFRVCDLDAYLAKHTTA